MQYTDKKGNVWDINLTVPKLIKICRKLGLSLQSITCLKIDVADMLEAIPLVLTGQLKDRGLTEEQFLEELDMRDVAGILQAFVDSVAEAFPEAKIGGGGGAAPFGLGNFGTSLNSQATQEPPPETSSPSES